MSDTTNCVYKIGKFIISIVFIWKSFNDLRKRLCKIVINYISIEFLVIKHMLSYL